MGISHNDSISTAFISNEIKKLNSNSPICYKTFDLKNCFPRINTEDIKIFVGSSKLSSVGMRYTAKDTIVHEQYDEPLNANDIGLIRVRDSIKFNDKVQPIKYTRKQVPANTDLQTFGWGRLSVSNHFLLFGFNLHRKCTKFKSKYANLQENGIRPDNLQVLTVHSISNEECNDEKFDLSIAAHESHLCTLDAANEGICAVSEILRCIEKAYGNAYAI